MSILALDYPSFDVLVVDNAPATTESRDLIAREFAGQPVQLIEEPVAGISNARNAALRHARGELIAFTDDDVIVDPLWLRALAAGFSRRADVDVVTGLVPSVELRTPTQAYFDDRVTWSRNLQARLYATSEPPADMPLFPFAVGVYGTGANFAARRDALVALGGFDTAFGAGTPTGGGEDIDIFFRILQAGRALAAEPAAIVWHRHRSDLAALRTQSRGYGVGLGAWLAKISSEPRTLRAALRRAPAGLSRLLARQAAGSVDAGAAGLPPFVPSGDLARAVSRMRWYELGCVALGPWRFLQQRRSGHGPGFPVAYRSSSALPSRKVLS
jgi:GT2 family glycosyltransferase